MYTLDQGEIFVRIIASVLAGALIGYEREMTGHPAGIRTHIFVSMGSCVLALIQMQTVYDAIAMVQSNEIIGNVVHADMTRLIAQIVSGIGFLGAGTIILAKSKIKGLTSAASIWATATIGIAMGMGYYFLGIVASAIIFFSLLLMKKIITYPDIYSFMICFSDQDRIVEKIESFMVLQKAIILNKRYSYDMKNGELYHTNHYKIDLKKISNVPLFFESLYRIGKIDCIDTTDFVDSPD